MIGSAEWFSPRKFGWGLGIRTKEGIIYVGAALLLMAAIFALPLPLDTRMLLGGGLFALLLLDTLHIMLSVYSKLDEREQSHQAIAERNSSYVAVACIVAYMAYFLISTGTPAQQLPTELAFPLVLLMLMAIAKGATLLYLEREK
ncbi:hypothetical protein J4441_02485 [Candidatus Micrarchaeota archaeon]|nr:hypothetical protein [Candidatus Micrarchaeota archaeon]